MCVFVCSGIQPEQHLQSGVRQEPAAQLQARRSHDAPGALPVLPVRGDSVVPLPPRQLRYVSPAQLRLAPHREVKHVSDVRCSLIGRSLHPGQPIPSLLQPQQPALLPPDTQPRSHALL